jgi:TDG/mug DNA glycosylase family protein
MTNGLARSFEPIAGRNAVVLILGSMPGQESLKAGRYYAHPRNQFWRIMGMLLGFEPDAPYDDRVAALRGAGLALWDVMHSCRRIGSLDAKIEPDSITANDFGTFFQNHPDIRWVFFNGAKAEAAYRQHVTPTVSTLPITYERLPSTSPAHAAKSLAEKLEAWRAVLRASQAFLPPAASGEFDERRQDTDPTK